MFTKSDISFLHQTKQKFLKPLFQILTNTNYDHFRSRVKSNSSIEHKLILKGYEPTPYNAVDYLTDIIGIRIITQYINDIYDIVHIIKQNYHIKEECDYIANPKSSGYRSYHLVINIPVDIEKFPYTDNLNIEIQIRTLGMDFWASLEHSLVYDKIKNPNTTTGDNMSLVHNELLNYAESIFSIDMRIQALQHITEHNSERHQT